MHISVWSKSSSLTHDRFFSPFFLLLFWSHGYSASTETEAVELSGRAVWEQSLRTVLRPASRQVMPPPNNNTAISPQRPSLGTPHDHKAKHMVRVCLESPEVGQVRTIVLKMELSQETRNRTHLSERGPPTIPCLHSSSETAELGFCIKGKLNLSPSYIHIHTQGEGGKEERRKETKWHYFLNNTYWFIESRI